MTEFFGIIAFGFVCLGIGFFLGSKYGTKVEAEVTAIEDKAKAVKADLKK